MLNATKTFKTKLANTTARFKTDEKGNFAIMAALTMGVILAGLGVSIDAANGQYAKQRLQNTTDAIALLAAKGVIETQADLDAAANEYLQLNYPGAVGVNIRLEDIERQGDVVTITASDKIPTHFAGIFGKTDMEIEAKSQAIYSNRNIDIAFVLDTTFSMSGSKMSNLKLAANNLVNTFDNYNNDVVRAAVVPFAQYINVGTSRRNASWLNVPADRQVTVTQSNVVARRNCRMVANTAIRDGVALGGMRRKCDLVHGPAYTTSATARWQGCVGSRLAPNHERVDFGGNRIPGILDSDGKCGTEILPLTTNMNQVRQTINAMNPEGKTYIPAGLAWGWRVLDNREPLTEAASSPANNTDKVMIIMTDGKNFKSKNGVLHNKSDNGSNADNITGRLCERIKDDDIKVFTIAYEVNDTPTRNLLRDCATSSSNYFNATNAAQLNSAFQAIGHSLHELRITA